MVPSRRRMYLLGHRRGHPMARIVLILVLIVVFLSSVDSEATATTTESEEIVAETIVNRTGSSSFADRQAALHTAIQNATSAQRNTYAQVVLAYLGRFPLDENAMNMLVTEAATSSNSDFAISKLVRILFFTDGTSWKEYYDDMILPTLKEESYWYTTECCDKNDDTMNSENHMLLWFSSAWLLNQREGWSVGGPTLRQRLFHYLRLKIKYGYYEFLSISYWPLTFQGLMNLVDFVQDDEIRTLAELAVQRLIADNLLFVNSNGIKYSVAGRDYAERFVNDAPYTLQQDGIIHLLTGLGRAPSIRRVAQDTFLSTSSFDFSGIVEQWQPYVDTNFVHGHTLEESFGINAQLDKYDRIVFQFSQGAYFHPLVAQDTVDFFQHFAPIVFTEEFTLDTWIQLIPPSVGPLVASAADRLSVGSVISGNTIRLYRSNGSMLSSVKDFWPGHVGYQTFVWMAVCDDVAVWTQSGPVYENWIDKSGDITNSHLPASIVQESNVALIVYQPYSPIRSEAKEVALYWPAQRFDDTTTVIPETSSDAGSVFLGFIWEGLRWIWQLIFGAPSPLGSWILGRRNDSYIAVYCPCGDRTVMGWFSCGGDQGRQFWVTVVGDATRHTSFADFTAVIQKAVVRDTSPSSWFRLFPHRGSIYSVTITVDDKTLMHNW